MRRIAGDRGSPAKRGQNKAPPRSVRSGLASRRGRRWWSGGSRKRKRGFFFVGRPRTVPRPTRNRRRAPCTGTERNTTKTRSGTQRQSAGVFSFRLNRTGCSGSLDGATRETATCRESQIPFSDDRLFHRVSNSRLLFETRLLCTQDKPSLLCQIATRRQTMHCNA